eukprot:357379-Chlamydomonas_euryale.AAC.4
MYGPSPEGRIRPFSGWSLRPLRVPGAWHGTCEGAVARARRAPPPVPPHADRPRCRHGCNPSIYIVPSRPARNPEKGAERAWGFGWPEKVKKLSRWRALGLSSAAVRPVPCQVGALDTTGLEAQVRTSREHPQISRLISREIAANSFASSSSTLVLYNCVCPTP